MGQRQRRAALTALAALLLPLLVSCSSVSPQAAGEDAVPTAREAPTRALTPAEVRLAISAARRALGRDDRSSVTSATAVARPGRLRASNTGHPCTSGRVLEIKLIGRFPGILTTGHGVLPGQKPPDFTVRAVVITADARTGRACLISVQTAERGPVSRLAHGTVLHLTAS